MSYHEKEDKAPATGVVGTVLGASALGLLLLGNRCNDGGNGCGLLGGLLGGNGNCYENSPKAVYDAEQARAGSEARTELYTLEKHILPIMAKQCEMEKQIAVNAAKDEAAFAIQTLMTDAKIEKATCGVIRGQTFLRPDQMADPYMGGINELVTRHYPRPFSGAGDCGPCHR